MKKSIVLVAAVTLAISACATVPPPIMKPGVDRLDSTAEKQVEKPIVIVKNDAPASIVQTVPSWFLDTPSSKEYVYVAGTGVSRDMGMSMQKAMLDAQAKAADRINSTVNSMMKQYKKDTGSDFQENTEFVIRKLVAEVKVHGYDVSNTTMVAEGQNYRTYVQLRFNAPAIAALSVKKVSPRGKDNAFKEMDRRIDAKKAEEKAEDETPPSDAVVKPVADNSGVVIKFTNSKTGKTGSDISVLKDDSKEED